MSQSLIDFFYVVASVLFIFGLKMLQRANTARRGNMISAVGMLIALVATLFNANIISFQWILIGVAIGTVIGVVSSFAVKMTAMPEMVAIFNAFGGLASLLVGWAEYQANPSLNLLASTSVYFAVIIGGITTTGSIIAWLKLAETISGKPFVFPGQKIFNAGVLLATLGLGFLFVMEPAQNYTPFLVLVGLSLALGVLVVIPIGGADMPVVVSLLNSYSGLAACAAGFIILNDVLIVAGALVGASGIILTNTMCKGMNRSLANVLFSGFGSVAKASSGYKGEANPINAEDTYLILEMAKSVVIVPGYGMAVAQAQHVVRELAGLLEENGCEVRFAIHPVAGRMPGHMNVLLAESNVPYEQLVEPQDVNPSMETVDVSIVIGANDVVNPAAREDKTSPLFGMPIIDVDRARTCIVLKRSLGAGFAGVDNPLFFKPNTRMLFGDAKATVAALVSQFKAT